MEVSTVQLETGVEFYHYPPDTPADNADIIAAMSDKPAHQRPELPDFWDHRFRSAVTPWDAGGVPAQLRDFADRLPADVRVLVPGCGSAYEAGYLATAPGRTVIALDFSAAAIAAARLTLGSWRGQLLHDDFFHFASEAPFDFVYERAFLCALPRTLWADYGRRMAELVRPGAYLAGYFLLGDDPKGPPFSITPDALDALLDPGFERVSDVPASDSIAVFAGRERWQVWRRRTAEHDVRPHADRTA